MKNFGFTNQELANNVDYNVQDIVGNPRNGMMDIVSEM